MQLEMLIEEYTSSMKVQIQEARLWVVLLLIRLSCKLLASHVSSADNQDLG